MPRQQGILKKNKDDNINTSEEMTLSTRSSTSNSSKSSSLDFGVVEVYHFPVTVGDHPYVSEGCPISMAWECEERTVVPFDSYESDMSSSSSKKDKKSSGTKDLRWSVEARAKLLLGAGYSLQEIALATMRAQETKRMRAETLRNQKWDDISQRLRSLIPRISMAKSA